MSGLFDVVVPGPWWHSLTYRLPGEALRGCRVKVPVGNAFRVGFVERPSAATPPNVTIREGQPPMDDSCPLGAELFETAFEVGKMFLCGPGEALKAIVPPPLLEGEPVTGLPEVPLSRHRAAESFCNYPLETDRWKHFVSLIENRTGGALVLFPERQQALSFWRSLPEPLRENGCYWASGDKKAMWRRWLDVRKNHSETGGPGAFVVGSHAAAFAPVQELSLIIVEDEGNPAYRAARYPFINARSAATVRSRQCDANLVLAGGMPSSRSYMRKPRKCHTPPQKRIRFFNRRDGRKIDAPGISFPLRIPDTVMESTLRHLARKEKALWIVDRKGYAGSLLCEDCGRSLACAKCGAPCRLEQRANRLVCPVCGWSRQAPEVCPFCGGYILQGRKPGMEAYGDVAKTLLGSQHPVFEWFSQKGKGAKEKRKLVAETANGGLVIGSRRALSLCDHIPFSVIVWLDADAAAFRPSYDARATAFRMIWESLWRGVNPLERTVILVSRAPGTGWQRGLSEGWHRFWEDELAERRELELPPNGYLAEVDLRGVGRDDFMSLLDDDKVDCMDPDPLGDTLWLKASRLSAMREAVAPLFGIERSRKGFPRLALWTE